MDQWSKTHSERRSEKQGAEDIGLMVRVKPDSAPSHDARRQKATTRSKDS
jgi:hypothetical protein